ncbi:type II toxin-antitoxin system RnlB family antitoxin [Pseudomonas shirazica]|uniref:type II toxin-antitoxin system RnlB family antitoxin n=1 Tax=Pseudomonas shirazica TaxID=1940636 RepID=UPI0025AA0557|nr:type II toxin-antitoxin system RnlB family antitoxin [Pseudomonas shirazica]MDM9599235.1 type II toxin-antitoxin system RnlB family antitoxin [Pseudomonas shirazica]MDO2412663.1 type II toxin-antitoxin system RnlB family antitoxin [Pseudomonas shirazica]
MNYLLEKKSIPKADVCAQVLAANPHSPFEHLFEIEKQLSKSKIKGKILFDMLLSNGSRKNRFFIADFDGEHILMRTLMNVDQNYDVFSKSSAAIFLKNCSVIDDTLLTTAMKYALNKGTPF